MAAKKTLDVVKQLADKLSKANGFDRVLPQLRFIEVDNGRCQAEFTVVLRDINLHGGIHGGFAAAVVDNVGAYALLSKDLIPGSATQLQMMYMAPAKIGTELVAEANTFDLDGNNAYVECEIRSKADGQLIAKGVQSRNISRP